MAIRTARLAADPSFTIAGIISIAPNARRSGNVQKRFNLILWIRYIMCQEERSRAKGPEHAP